MQDKKWWGIKYFKHMTTNYLESIDLHFLTQLLPYDPAQKTEANTRNGLKEYLLLLIAAQQAIECWMHGALEHFDSLVGENACQIRAVKIAVTSLENSINPHLLNKINDAIRTVHAILDSASSTSGASFQEIIKREAVDIPLNANELFLIQSYLLSKVKISRPFKPELPLVKNEYTDTKKIKEISDVGTMFSEGLVKKLRESVSISSVKFVQELAAQLPPTDWGVDLTSDRFIVNHRGLSCLPCYWMTKVLMQEVQSKGIPIVMLAEQVARDQNYEVLQKMALFFKATPEGYQEIHCDELDPCQPALILLGKTCREAKEFSTPDQWKTELLNYSPIDLVLAYAAAHRQYPDPTKDHLVSGSKDEGFSYHKAKSEEWGCSVTNPSLFFLSHAYCDSIKNITV